MDGLWVCYVKRNKEIWYDLKYDGPLKKKTLMQRRLVITKWGVGYRQK